MKLLRSRDAAKDRLNCLFYGPPGSGKTHLGLTFPGPVLVDFEDGFLTAVSEGYDVPILQPETWEELLEILETPLEVTKDIQAVSGFEDYRVQTWVFDTVSTMQTMLLGYSYRAKTDKREAMPGRGILGETRNRSAPNVPTLEDYKDLNMKVTAFFNAVRQMPYHTVINAHATLDRTADSPRGINVDESSVRYAGFPVLTGQLKYHGGGLADFYVYLEKKAGKYIAHTDNTGPWSARTKIAQHLDKRIEDPSFEKLYKPLKEVVSSGKA